MDDEGIFSPLKMKGDEDLIFERLVDGVIVTIRDMQGSIVLMIGEFSFSYLQKHRQTGEERETII